MVFSISNLISMRLSIQHNYIYALSFATYPLQSKSHFITHNASALIPSLIQNSCLPVLIYLQWLPISVLLVCNHCFAFTFICCTTPLTYQILSAFIQSQCQTFNTHINRSGILPGFTTISSVFSIVVSAICQILIR